MKPPASPYAARGAALAEWILDEEPQATPQAFARRLEWALASPPSRAVSSNAIKDAAIARYRELRSN